MATYCAAKNECVKEDSILYFGGVPVPGLGRMHKACYDKLGKLVSTKSKTRGSRGSIKFEIGTGGFSPVTAKAIFEKKF